MKNENLSSRAAEAMDSKIDSIINLNRKAGNYFQQGDYEKAVQSYTEALEFLTETESSKKQEIKAILLNNLGHAQVKIGDLDNALDSFKLKGDKSGLADQYSDIGYICVRKKEFESARKWFYKAKALYEELNMAERARLVEKNLNILSASG